MRIKMIDCKQGAFHTHFKVQGMFIVEDRTVTVK